jgi:hypothetical protein
MISSSHYYQKYRRQEPFIVTPLFRFLLNDSLMSQSVFPVVAPFVPFQLCAPNKL